MRYRLDDREVHVIVYDEAEDRNLGEGWTDPAGVRVVEVPTVKESLTVEPRKPGRPRKESK